MALPSLHKHAPALFWERGGGGSAARKTAVHMATGTEDGLVRPPRSRWSRILCRDARGVWSTEQRILSPGVGKASCRGGSSEPRSEGVATVIHNTLDIHAVLLHNKVSPNL